MIVWRNLRTILRQNKKIVLLQFLFGRGYSYQDPISHLEDQIQTLQNQVNSFQQKIIQLEQNQTLEIKKSQSELLKRSQASKIDQQGGFKSEQSLQEAISETLPSETYAFHRDRENKALQ